LRNKHRARMDFTRERMDGLTDNEFKDRYKVGKRTFQNIADKLRPVLEPNHARAIASSGSPVTTELMLSITLRFLAGTPPAPSRKADLPKPSSLRCGGFPESPPCDRLSRPATAC
jgi:hypothetical protein